MINVVILAGGQGTRFWPISTRDNPKQFLKLFGPKSLIQLSYERALKITKNENIYVVTGKKYLNKTKEHLPKLPKKNIIIEPIAKNTAPALCLAALKLKKENPKSVMVVLAADHLIQKENDFAKIVKMGSRIALENDCLITLGIKPTNPETGYGYIKSKSLLKGEKAVYTVDCFVEKPDLKTAKKYLKTGTYYWNSGMFIWRVDTFLENIKKYAPKLYKSFSVIEKSKKYSNLEKEFNKIKKESIDYALMEKADKVLVMAADIGWNDVGSWSALVDVTLANKNNCVVIGSRNICFDSCGNVVYSNKPVGTIGIKDTIIIAGENGILVCPKDRAQEVKKITESFYR